MTHGKVVCKKRVKDAEYQKDTLFTEGKVYEGLYSERDKEYTVRDDKGNMHHLSYYKDSEKVWFDKHFDKI